MLHVILLPHWVSRGKEEVLGAEKCVQQKKLWWHNANGASQMSLYTTNTSWEKRKPINPLERTTSWWKSFYILEQERIAGDFRSSGLTWATWHISFTSLPYVPLSGQYSSLLEEVHVCVLIYEEKNRELAFATFCVSVIALATNFP